MAQFIVRNLEDDVRDKLREIASNHGQSMEETVREILRRAVMSQSEALPDLGSQLASLFAPYGIDKEIEELRGHHIEPMSFDQ